jgi:hypothetical protein
MAVGTFAAIGVLAVGATFAGMLKFCWETMLEIVGVGLNAESGLVNRWCATYAINVNTTKLDRKNFLIIRVIRVPYWR